MEYNGREKIYARERGKKEASGTEQSSIKRKLGIHTGTHIQYNIPISVFTLKRYFFLKNKLQL